MKRCLKWLAGLLLGGVILLVAAALIVPRFIDLDRYTPQIENWVSETTGRSFSMGSAPELSFYPWVGASIAGLELGSSSDASSAPLARVASFELKVKLLPLLRRDVEIGVIHLKSPHLFLERRKDGTSNWRPLMLTPSEPADNTRHKKTVPVTGTPDETAAGGSALQLPVNTLNVEQVRLTNGRIDWQDQQSKKSLSITDIEMDLQDISLEAPMAVTFSARMDETPVFLKGKIAPLGKTPGQTPLDIALELTVTKLLNLAVSGSISGLTSSLRYDVNVEIPPFSPRDLLDRLKMADLLKTQPSDRFTQAGFSGHLTGTPDRLDLADGRIILDDSRLDMTAAVNRFDPLDIQMDASLSALDLDRYLPAEPRGSGPGKPKEKTTGTFMAQEPEAEPQSNRISSAPKTSSSGGPNPATAEPSQRTDYGFIRPLRLNLQLNTGQVKVRGLILDSLNLSLNAENGGITLDPVLAKLYQGNLTLNNSVNLQGPKPRVNIQLSGTGIQAGPLLRDTLQKEFLEGTLKADTAVSFTGVLPEEIKRSLDGEGTLVFTDGALKGVDLADMVRNIGSAFGKQSELKEKPRTDFAELNVPFSLEKGRFITAGTTLASPLIRVAASGSADLVRETLNFRVQPKFVATLKGQGDTGTRSGLTVPIKITGPFDDPRFRPDIEAALKTTVPEAKALSQEVEKLLEDKEGTREKLKQLESTGKELLRGLLNPKPRTTEAMDSQNAWEADPILNPYILNN